MTFLIPPGIKGLIFLLTTLQLQILLNAEILGNMNCFSFNFNFRRAHVFCLILSMAVNLQKCRGEIGVFYNRSSKYTFVRYSYKFNNILVCLLLRIFSCLAFCIVTFIKALKNYTGFILKLSMISLHLSISQLWIYSHRRINLSGDIELNPGSKRDISQFFLM